DLTGTVALDRFHENAAKFTAPDPPNKSADQTNIELMGFVIDPSTGNITRATGPNGHCVDFAFDSAYKQLPTATTKYKAGCDSSQPLVTNQSFSGGGREFAVPTMVTDTTGAVAMTTLDDRGRPIVIEQPDPGTLGMSVASANINFNNDAPVGP